MRYRVLPWASTVAALCLTAVAQGQPDIEPKDGRLTIPVTLTPNDYWKPASRAYLLPDFRESIPGNRVQMFLRCFMEQDIFFGRAESDRREEWNKLPLASLPSSLKDYGGRLVERDLYDAARMTNVDWQLGYFLRRDGFNTLLPDLQKMRALANVLKTRVRGEIAAGDPRAALHTLKTFFGLARTLEAQPTLIGHLVGTAIATIAVNTVEELIQLPGCPNLFWALTDLPAPLLSLRPALEGERLFISGDFDALREAADMVVDSAVLKKIDHYDELFRVEAKLGNQVYNLEGRPKEILLARAKDPAFVKMARLRLIEAGLKATNVHVWSPLHVVVLDEIQQYETFRDELGKWLNLPYWQAKPGIDAMDANRAKAVAASPFASLVPAVAKVKNAQARLDQRICYLVILEAIRLHAFNNRGSLPATLAEIKLPLPVDPVRGAPFEYSAKDGVAVLHGTNATPGADVFNRYYEIRIKK